MFRIVRSNPKTPKFKDALAYLQDFFAKADCEEQRKLWQVLTALRGPDNDDLSLKFATTAVIRKKFLGKGDATVNELFAVVCPDSETRLLRRSDTTTRFDHFLEHARVAFVALGLDWDKVNK